MRDTFQVLKEVVYVLENSCTEVLMVGLHQLVYIHGVQNEQFTVVVGLILEGCNSLLSM